MKFADCMYETKHRYCLDRVDEHGECVGCSGYTKGDIEAIEEMHKKAKEEANSY